MLLNPKYMQARAQTGLATVDNSALGSNSPPRHTSFGNYNGITSDSEITRPRAKTTMAFHSGGNQRKRKSFP
jgi:hypothetical protein